MSPLPLSNKHGLNPSVALCFICNEPNNELYLLGRLPGDAEAPHQAVFNMEPCDKCKGHIGRGVILISVDEKKSTVREHTCRRCNHVWESSIRMSNSTANLSGEVTEYCQKCNNPSVNSSPHKLSKNPYRTGGWVVVTRDFISRIITPPELAEEISKKGMAFVPDEAWDAIGLPRGAVEGIPSE